MNREEAVVHSMPRCRVLHTAKRWVFFFSVCVFFLGEFFFASQTASAAIPSKKPFFVRVLVAEERTYLDITAKYGATLRLLPSNRTTQAPVGSPLHGRLVPTSNGFRFGKEELLCQAISIEPARDRELFLDDTRFRGIVNIYKAKNGLMFATNHLDIESYLYGVLHHEVAPWWPMEALKAQAVAARSYAYYQAQVRKSSEYDVKSGTSSQMYGGSTTERFRSKRAVDHTAGQILAYQGKVFPAYFHATCAGVTAGARELWRINLPPLAGGVKCDYCRLSPHYYWQAKVPLSLMEEKLKQSGHPVGQALKIEPVTQTPSGRVGRLKITGTEQEAVIAAKDFRVLVGGDLIRSTLFTVEVKDDAVEFHGKGWGHGVGLCQWGALGQSLIGKSYKDILKFYYPGSTIINYRESKM